MKLNASTPEAHTPEGTVSASPQSATPPQCLPKTWNRRPICITQTRVRESLPTFQQPYRTTSSSAQFNATLVSNTNQIFHSLGILCCGGSDAARIFAPWWAPALRVRGRQCCHVSLRHEF